MTDTTPGPEAQGFHLQVLRYLDGELLEQELQALRDQLLREPESVRRFVQHVQAALFVRETVQRDESVRRELALPSGQDFNFNEVIALLTPPEDLPPIEVIETIKHNRCTPHDPASRITLGQTARVVGYLFKQSRSAQLVSGAIAACLVVAVSLYLFVNTNDPEPRLVEQNAAQPDATDPSPGVATLSDAQGAVWRLPRGSKAPVVGDQLYLGQRLSLVSGTAKITTRQGAIANLQSPCTIELLEGGNALSLISGRLVGICETPASKGFLVYTAQAEIADLGTRFGVDATRDEVTEVHIFEGKVKVLVPRDEQVEGGERVLSAGQAVAARGEGEALVDIAGDMERFSAIRANKLTLTARAATIEGVRTISGDLQEGSASSFIGRDAADWPVSRQAFVFHDFVGRLHFDGRANFVDPGTYSANIDAAQASTIPAGTDLRSYIIFMPGGAPGETAIVRGSVTFEKEVIGIIIDQGTAEQFERAIRATSPVFSPGAGAGRWIDRDTFQEGVTLSEDRRTVTFQFQVKESADTIRVLVRAR